MIRVNNGDFHFEYKGNGKVYMKIIDNVFYCDVPIYNRIKQDFGRYLEGNIIKYIAKQGIEIEDIKIISPEKLKSL